jgi:hypothetical protein
MFQGSEIYYLIISSQARSDSELSQSYIFFIAVIFFGMIVKKPIVF